MTKSAGRCLRGLPRRHFGMQVSFTWYLLASISPARDLWGPRSPAHEVYYYEAATACIWGAVLIVAFNSVVPCLSCFPSTKSRLCSGELGLLSELCIVNPTALLVWVTGLLSLFTPSYCLTVLEVTISSIPVAAAAFFAGNFILIREPYESKLRRLELLLGFSWWSLLRTRIFSILMELSRSSYPSVLSPIPGCPAFLILKVLLSLLLYIVVAFFKILTGDAVEFWSVPVPSPSPMLLVWLELLFSYLSLTWTIL